MSDAQARITEALARLRRQRALMVLDHPFFGLLSLQLKTIEDVHGKRTQKIATDGRAIFYHAPYIDSLDDMRLQGIIAKTVMHPAMMHHVRRGFRDEALWNRAATNAIVGPLLRAGFMMPADIEYEPRFDGQSAERIYATLKEEQPPEPEEPEGEEADDAEAAEAESEDGQGEDTDDEGDQPGGDGGEGGSEGEGSGEGQGEGRGQGGGGDGGGSGTDSESQVKDMAGAVLDAPDPVDDTAKWEMATIQCARAAQMQGDLPAEFARLLGEAQRPRFDTRALLMRFAQEQCKSDYSWKRPNVKYIRQDLYLPEVNEPAMGGIALIIDSSGSISDDQAKRFLGICQTVVDQVRPRFVRVLVSDARVHADHRFEREEDITGVQVIGGGGTDFRPAFNLLADDSDEAPACIMYLTDGYGTYPNEHDCVAPVLWCMTTDKIAPHGETVRLEEDAA
jgi:predicted metal-dependent peptidase